MIRTRERDRETNPHPIVATENLVKSYGSGDETVRAVDGVSLSVEAGSIVGLLGPNGAGKTTLIELLLGLAAPTGGSVSIDGIDVDEAPHRAHARVAAVLGGARSTYWRLTVRENVEFFAHLNGSGGIEDREWLSTFLDRLGLTDKMDDVVNTLSRGEKQKVSLATALVQDADVLVLDEPTHGLDVESSAELRTILAELATRRAVTILVSSHDMATIEAICDRVLVLDDGEIVADDSVDNLLDVLRTRTYELVVEGDVTDPVRTGLERNYDLVSRETFQEQTKLTVAVSNANRVHDLTGLLVANGVQIRSIRTTDAGFEAVFSSLVADRPRAVDARVGQGGR